MRKSSAGQVNRLAAAWRTGACNREQLSAVSYIVLDASSAAEALRNIRRMALADV